MTRRLWALIACLWPIIGLTEPLVVQTGEHNAFTRVVVTIPEGSDWQFVREPDGYRLQAPTREGFDLEGFFDLIPRSRILEVTQIAKQGELFFRVECTCNAQTSLFQSRFLVIDIADGAPSEPTDFEVADLEATFLYQDLQPETDAAATYLPRPNRILPLITPRFLTQPSEDGLAEPVLDEAEEMIAKDESIEGEKAGRPLRQLERSLTTSLGRGLSEGLLEQSLSLETNNQGILNNSAIESDVAFPGLEMQSGIDPLAVMVSSSRQETQTGRACLPPAAFDISAWGDASPPHQQISEARRVFVDDADQVREGELVRLARLYVFLGFGMEAQQVLDADAAQSRKRMILRAIAQIIEDEGDVSDLFSGQVSCPTNVALWALLAQRTGPVDGQVDRMAVVNAFKDLPAYVRSAVSARLVEALLAIGAEDEAMQILGRNLADHRKDVNLALAGAALANALGEEVQAIETISDVARNGQRPTPEAMTRFFREGIRNAVSFSEEDFLLADALRFEMAQSALEAALADVQFDAYLYSDRFAEGRNLLRARKTVLPNTMFVQARQSLLRQATERMPDASFLEFIWLEEPGAQSAETRKLIAERLSDLDFLDRALLWRNQIGSGDVAADPRFPDPLQLEARSEITEVLESRRAIPVESNLSSFEPPLFSQEGTRPSLQNSRALVGSALEAREQIEDLLESNPAPADF